MVDLSGLVQFSVQAALLITTLLLLPCAYRVAVAESSAELLQVIDTITTLLIGIIALLALSAGNAQYIDVAIALAALAFIGTLGVARFLAEGKAF
ncbi:MAG: pH regulation protein F [Anaerolineae bacterium]|nr:pH regulation protein F [Anaerolineae bacterium]